MGYVLTVLKIKFIFLSLEILSSIMSNAYLYLLRVYSILCFEDVRSLLLYPRPRC